MTLWIFWKRTTFHNCHLDSLLPDSLSHDRMIDFKEIQERKEGNEWAWKRKMGRKGSNWNLLSEATAKREIEGITLFTNIYWYLNRNLDEVNTILSLKGVRRCWTKTKFLGGGRRGGGERRRVGGELSKVIFITKMSTLTICYN